jgi:hypothetical protein
LHVIDDACTAFHVQRQSAYRWTAANADASVVVVVEFLGSVAVGDLDFVARVVLLLFDGAVVVVVVGVVDDPAAAFNALWADWISASMELMSLW